MCLTKVNEYHSEGKGVGYKAIRRMILSDRTKSPKYQPHTFYQPLFCHTFYCFNLADWNVATPVPLIDDLGQPYESGFHIFKKLQDAHRYSDALRSLKVGIEIWEVEYDELSCEGLQRFSSSVALVFADVLVAKKIKFIKQIEDSESFNERE